MDRNGHIWQSFDPRNGLRAQGGEQVRGLFGPLLPPDPPAVGRVLPWSGPQTGAALAAKPGLFSQAQ